MPLKQGGLSSAFSHMFPNHSSTLTDSGRSAFAVVIERLNLENKTILMPAFLCNALLPVLKHYNITPLYIDIDPNTLEPPKEAYTKELLDESDAVLLVATFGAPVSKNILRMLKKKDVLLIEDYAHVPLPREPLEQIGGDARFYSLPKTIALPDGGLAITKKPHAMKNLPEKTLSPFSKEWLKLFPSTSALISRIKFLAGGPTSRKPTWKGIRNPSTITKKLLLFYLFKEPPQAGRKYAYPVYTTDAHEAYLRMARNEIAAERLWMDPIALYDPRQKKQYPHTEYASKHLLCIPGWHIHTKEGEEKYMKRLKEMFAELFGKWGQE